MFWFSGFRLRVGGLRFLDGASIIGLKELV